MIFRLPTSENSVFLPIVYAEFTAKLKNVPRSNTMSFDVILSIFIS